MILVTGSGGLVGSACVNYFIAKGHDVVGIDNNSREKFFGPAASVQQSIRQLRMSPGYIHYINDITGAEMDTIFRKHDIKCVIHAAAQPSHDWATDNVIADFNSNAWGTLNLLEAARRYRPDAVFIYVSTNKVYGDSVNKRVLHELTDRYDSELLVDETQPVDLSSHSLFGCSKLAADLYVQEYGRRFGMKTACFRGGCLTGANHQGVPLHGFLNYLVKCAITGEPYTIYGYKGKQVRDNIHASDVAAAFWHFFQSPKVAAVYNLGGGRDNGCSIIEAAAIVKNLCGKELLTSYNPSPRYGDHQWYITDMSKFKKDYPAWRMTYSLPAIITEIINRYQS